MLNLDTHIVIYAMTGRVSDRETSLLRSNRWGISDVVLWEIAKLAQLGRIEIDMQDPEVERFLGSIHVWPISLEVARAISELDFRADPVDEIIAATSIIHRAPLLTRDKRLLGSAVVPLAG